MTISHAPRDLRISTPGRVCLFGEHQDYLGLPVIPCAISLRITMDAARTPAREARIHLPDIGREERFGLNGRIPYTVDRDYFRSAANVMLRHGYTFSGGIEAVVHGEIPINAGSSSSSALIVTWIGTLARLSDQQTSLDPDACARLAHEAEVLEFGEPGGMMDHFSTAYGGVIAIDFHPSINVRRLPASLKTFVLGDSREPKDTKGILARVKDRVIDAARMLRGKHSSFSLHTAEEHDLDAVAGILDPPQRDLLRGTLRNHAITRKACGLLESANVDHHAVGRLLAEHQVVLRDVLRISTPKIDRMLDAALKAGAAGGKINGSGGGGCMFAYAPEHPERVAEAIEREGGKAYIITADVGTRVEALEVLD
jgi:galactokinase